MDDHSSLITSIASWTGLLLGQSLHKADQLVTATRSLTGSSTVLQEIHQTVSNVAITGTGRYEIRQ